MTMKDKIAIESKEGGECARSIAEEMGKILEMNIKSILDKGPDKSVEILTLVMNALIIVHCDNMTGIFSNMCDWKQQDYLDALVVGVQETWKQAKSNEHYN